MPPTKDKITTRIPQVTVIGAEHTLLIETSFGIVYLECRECQKKGAKMIGAAPLVADLIVTEIMQWEHA